MGPCRQADDRGAEERQDRADVRGQLEADELHDVVVDAPALADRKHDGREVVVRYRPVGRFRDFLVGERAYIALSFVAKSALAWQVFAAILTA